DGDYFPADVDVPARMVGPLLPRNGDIPTAEGRKDASLDAFYPQPRNVFRRYSIEIEHYNLPLGPRDCSKAILNSWRETFSTSASSRMWKTLSRRSEERRVGKECRCRWAAEQYIRVVETV